MTNQYFQNVLVVKWEKVVSSCCPVNIVNWIITTRDSTIRKRKNISVNHLS